jgi:hypothetical protein
VVPRSALRATLGRVLGLLRNPLPAVEAAPPSLAEAEPRGAE